MKFMQMHHTKWEKNALLGYKCPVSESMFLDVLHMHTQVQAHTHTHKNTCTIYTLPTPSKKEVFQVTYWNLVLFRVMFVGLCNWLLHKFHAQLNS